MLTDTEKDIFDGILAEGWEKSLVRSKLDGKDVAVICLVDRHPNGMALTPVAIILDAEMVSKLETPDGSTRVQL